MSASKSLLLFLPAVAVAFPLAASAQNGAVPVAPTAALTAPARPATAIAPRQSLPAFSVAKMGAAPVAARPSAASTPPAANTAPTAKALTTIAPVTAAAAPAKTTSAPAWSQRETPALGAPQPLNAPAAKTRARRAYAAAVSATTAPAANLTTAAPLTLTPTGKSTVLTAPAPVVLAPVAAPTMPKVAAKTGATPSRLASREARARELQLARLDAQLARAENRLDRAQSRLTEGQRQLGSVTNLLQNAIITQGAGARGLHPFVRVAQRYLGTPYVWGGESARGFDCSGFIMRVMRDLGYQALPHSAAEQFNYGKPVAKPFLQPGDIVFFQNTYKPGVSHVGIYLGNGRFIHAANSQVGTIVSSLNEQKWIDHYAGARRLMKVG